VIHRLKMWYLRRKVAKAAVAYFGGLEDFAAECKRKREEGES
jgi:hypothetical protein